MYYCILFIIIISSFVNVVYIFLHFLFHHILNNINSNTYKFLKNQSNSFFSHYESFGHYELLSIFDVNLNSSNISTLCFLQTSTACFIIICSSTEFFSSNTFVPPKLTGICSAVTYSAISIANFLKSRP